MTERAKRGIKKTWDITRTITLWSLILASAHQAVDLRGKVADQQERETATAASVVALMKDVGKLRSEVRVLRAELKRSGGRSKPESGLLSHAADKPASASGPLQIVGRVVSAPFRLVGWLIGGI